MTADSSASDLVSVDISGLPQTVLPGASIAHARSLAMALARTKGWEIRQAVANQILLERPLRPDAPEHAAFGAAGSPLRPPRRQVQTNLVEGRDGAIVALRAFVVADPGTPGERRIDVTGQSQAAFQDSFASLQRAWAEGRGQIVRPLPAMTAEQVAASTGAVDRAIAASAGGASAPTPTSAPTPAPAPASTAAPSTAAAPARAPQPAGPVVAAGRPASA